MNTSENIISNSIDNANSNSSFDATEESLDENVSSIRKRKNYFNCNRVQKWKNRNLIGSRLDVISQFCGSLGLKIDEIIHSPINPINNIQTDLTKITVLEQDATHEYQVFKSLMAKDLANMSNKKYELIKTTYKDLKTIRMPGIKAVKKLQYDLNNFFPI